MIALPKKFKQDTQGKDTYLTPLVSLSGNMNLSTSKISMNGINYNPIIKSIGKIKESIDVDSKLCQISSVQIKCYNYEKNNSTLTESLFSGEIMNTPLTIFFKSQSAKTTADCLKVYSGYVKDIIETPETVIIYVEDRTDQTIRKEVPYKYTESEGLPEKHRNKPIPIVYGYVEKAPLAYFLSDGEAYTEGAYLLKGDDFYIQSVDSPIVFYNSIYGLIEKEAGLFEDYKDGTIYANVTTNQYELDVEPDENGVLYSQSIVIAKTISESDEFLETNDADGHIGTPIAFNMVEITSESQVKHTQSEYALHWNLFADGINRFAKTNILSFSDQAGEIPKRLVGAEGDMPEGLYLMPKAFSNQTVEMPYPVWFFNQNKHHDFPVGAFQNLMGVSVMNFEADPWIDESKMVDSFPLADTLDDSEPIKGKVILDYDLSASAAANVIEDVQKLVLPRLTFMWSDGGGEIWDIKDDNSLHPDQFDTFTYYEVHSAGAADNSIEIDSVDVSNNKFSIGLRDRNPAFGNWYLEHDSGFVGDTTNTTNRGYLEWLRFNSMTVKRTGIVKDFINYDLYGEVHGRVDDENYRYTQASSLLSSAEKEQVKQEFDRGIGRAPSRPSLTGRITSQPKKRKKIVKKTTKGGY